MVNKPIFCALAFGSASINSYGEYIPCCNIRTDEWEMYKDGHYDHGMLTAPPKIRINAPNLKQLRKQLINGEWPKACENCRQAEDAGVGSMRTIWNKSLEEYDIPVTEQVSPENIYYLDLTFSTKCNSKCMTCSPDLSDFWQEEYEKIWRIKPYNKVQYKRVCIDDASADSLAREFPNVRNVSFIGGEPTISEEHIRFLEILISQGRSKNISLSYVTNLTGINPELVSLWNHFKSVHVSVSIDGYGKVNEYIRYPIKWNKTEQNLRMFLDMVRESAENKHIERTEFTIGLSCTVSIFNAIQCMDLFEFWFDLTSSCKVDDKTLGAIVGCFVNRVSHPQHALVGLLSKEYRQQGIEKGNMLLKKIEDFDNNFPDYARTNHGLSESIKLTMNWLEEEQIIDSVFLSQNKHLITESDEYRNRQLKDFMPELWKELNKIWKQGINGEYYLEGENPVK